MRRIGLVAAAVLAITSGSAFAQQGTGPVARACADDLAKYCAGKPHQGRDARTCLEANKAKVTAACKAALDSTGGGKGRK